MLLTQFQRIPQNPIECLHEHRKLMQNSRDPFEHYPSNRVVLKSPLNDEFNTRT